MMPCHLVKEIRCFYGSVPVLRHGCCHCIGHHHKRHWTCRLSAEPHAACIVMSASPAGVARLGVHLLHLPCDSVRMARHKHRLTTSFLVQSKRFGLIHEEDDSDPIIILLTNESGIENTEQLIEPRLREPTSKIFVYLSKMDLE